MDTPLFTRLSELAAGYPGLFMAHPSAGYDVALILCHAPKPADYYEPVPRSTDAGNLLYLTPPLTRRGLNPFILNPGVTSGGVPMGLLTQLVRESGARAIGVSAPSKDSHIEAARLLTNSLAVETGLPIVVGGYITLVDDIIEKLPAIDVLFRGEGEVRAPDVFAALIDPSGPRYDLLQEIPGLVIRKKTSPNPPQLLDTHAPPPILDVDDLVPDLELLTRFPIHAGHPEMTQLYASRGCYARCTFCSIVAQAGKKWRRMSGPKINKVIRTLATNHGIRLIDFNDDDFLAGRSGRIDEMAPTLRELGCKIWFQTRAVDVIRHCEELGRNADVIYRVSMGVESFSQSQLDRWNKNTCVAQNLEAAHILNRTGIFYECYLMMVDHETGFPELVDNLRGIMALPPLEGTPYLLRAFSLPFFPPVNPLRDLLGEDHLPEGLRRFHTLIFDAHSLNLRLPFEEAVRDGDHDRAELILLSAVSLFRTAILTSFLDSTGDYAESLHKLITGRLSFLLRTAPDFRKRRGNMADVILPGEDSTAVPTAVDVQCQVSTLALRAYNVEVDHLWKATLEAHYPEALANPMTFAPASAPSPQ